jgi:hypothetical protein
MNAAYLENAMRVGGVLHGVASSVLTEQAELSPNDVADIIMPPKVPDQPTLERFRLVENAPAAVKAAAAERETAVLELTSTLGMREATSLSPERLARVDLEKAVWVVEGGANRTSIVRRQLALDAVAALYGEQASEQTVYQFGSARAIPQEKNGKPNPEYTVARQVAETYLPAGDTLTEFDLNVATARQAGYELSAAVAGADLAGAERVIYAHKPDAPALVLVQPKKVQGGLKDAFHALHARGALEGKQLVIATNGQYRPKDELQAAQWAQTQEVPMLPPVALGDEPGYAVAWGDSTLTTAQRGAVAYLNEMVILHRLSGR